ncbi:MAG: galactokinase [Akkermansia sp.]|nr:galactokinase [Akkermansia sp.]
MDLDEREISAETITPYFEQYFGHKPQVIAASPGRVNLIGEHTDYNEGFVLPMALNKINVVAVAPSPTGQHRWIGALGEQPVVIDPADADKTGDPFWSNYVRGVICMLGRRGIKVPPVDMLIDSNVPRGGGLSSSAAFEVSACTALAALCGAEVTPTERALIGQATEHEFVNVPCGIMDQFISANGQKDHALMLDCKDLSYKLIPMTDPAVSVLVIDSAVKHSLADGGYAARRKNCEDACAILGIHSLREATLEQLDAAKAKLGDLCYRRARHVVGENLRVAEFAEAVAAGDWNAAGRAMRGSHASLRDDFEVSCAEVDTLVSLADTIPSAAAVYGARMTGGGFGGCIVALVKSDSVEQVAHEMLDAYRDALGIETAYLVTRPGAGARILYQA